MDNETKNTSVDINNLPNKKRPKVNTAIKYFLLFLLVAFIAVIFYLVIFLNRLAV